MTVIDQSLGQAFEDADVARCYAARPPYPPELYQALFALTARHGLAADLGCGPGKIARVLAGRFDRVEAIDPAASMIAAGGFEDGGVHPNIEWINAPAEAVVFDGPYDLVTAGASIHWMQHADIFPRLAAAMHPEGVVAIISGDDVSSAVWKQDWGVFSIEWLERLGHVPDPHGYDMAGRSYEPWMDRLGSADFVFPFIQSVSDFIACQHSRATWARATMGEALAEAFDEELLALLEPHAVGGRLHYEVRSTLVWGRPRVEVAI